ncbi:MAG: hypothetical protein JSU94_02185 [Phycisphaerales bacterium]|nr:MAG: hypothetical protein JSU94_02185 [Phycisphaerales bacterium]
MNVYDSLSSPEGVLNEQIAQQMFEVLPEKGPIMAIMSRQGSFWPSDSERFCRLNIDEAFLKELCAKIDDGDEPVITQSDECSIVAAQLATERTDCGYVIVALPQSSPESTLINTDLIEMLLSQVGLIARLIEKNNRLYEAQMKQRGMYRRGCEVSN